MESLWKIKVRYLKGNFVIKARIEEFVPWISLMADRIVSQENRKLIHFTYNLIVNSL